MVILSEAKDLLSPALIRCHSHRVLSRLLGMHQLFVYILASKSHRLYTGVTGNLETRVLQHRKGEVTFTARYRINRLVYYERLGPPIAAIQREKQIKGWVRAKKVALIESVNPKWDDLAAEWFDDVKPTADPSLRSG